MENNMLSLHNDNEKVNSDLNLFSDISRSISSSSKKHPKTYQLKSFEFTRTGGYRLSDFSSCNITLDNYAKEK